MIIAIGRIERALARIEKSVRTPRLPLDSGGDEALRQRHERLKAETRSAIADIDRILQDAG